MLLGDYGPDAGATDPNRGPQGSVEFNVVKEPGFYGWPYCVRDNVPYNDYDFATGHVGPEVQLRRAGQQLAQQHGPDQPAARQPATMWIGYTETDPRFPGLGTGGAPTGGPRYDFDPDLDTRAKFPAFYDGHWFIGEWNNGWIKTATLERQRRRHRRRSRPRSRTRFLRPHEIEFGPDGSLYVIDWGTGFGGNNLDSGIYRIDYVAGARRPIAHATADADNGPDAARRAVLERRLERPRRHGADLRVGLRRQRHDRLDRANPTHTYTTAGTYNATLTVTDADGQTAIDTVQIVAGNTRPTVTIDDPRGRPVRRLRRHRPLRDHRHRPRGRHDRLQPRHADRPARP